MRCDERDWFLVYYFPLVKAIYPSERQILRVAAPNCYDARAMGRIRSDDYATLFNSSRELFAGLLTAVLIG